MTVNFIVFVDDNYVQRAINPAAIMSVVLEYNGITVSSRPCDRRGRPTASICLTTGEVLDGILIPFVDNPVTDAQIQGAVFDFFDRLATGEPQPPYGKRPPRKYPRSY